MYSEADHEDLHLAHDHLHLAAELINGVMDRRRLQSTMQEISLLSGAKHDADLAEQELGMAEKYMQWDGVFTAPKVDSSAATDMGWRDDEPAAS